MSMSNDAFDISILARQRDLLAIVVPAADLVGFLRRSVEVPMGWTVLLIGQEGHQTVVEAGKVFDAGETSQVMFVRSGPVPMTSFASVLTIPRAYELFATSYRARLRKVRRTSGLAAASALKPSALVQWRRFPAVVAAASYRPSNPGRGMGRRGGLAKRDRRPNEWACVSLRRNA